MCNSCCTIYIGNNGKNNRNILSINFINHVYRRIICENFCEKKKYFNQIPFSFFFSYNFLFNQSRNQLNLIQSEHNSFSV